MKYTYLLRNYLSEKTTLIQIKQSTNNRLITTGRKEMFYLTMHSTNFIYGYMASGIWERTIQIEREENTDVTTLQGMFYMHHPIDRIACTTAFVNPVMEHWLEWEIAQWVHHEGSIWQVIALWIDVLPEVHLAPIFPTDTQPT